MIYFLVRIFVNVLAVVATVGLLPNINFSNADMLDIELELPNFSYHVESRVWAVIIALCIVGAVVAVVNWAITPVLMLIAGGVVVWSFGLLLVVVNAIVLFLSLSTFITYTPDNSQMLYVSSRNILYLLLGGLIFTLSQFTLEGITGLDSPLKDRPNSRRAYWRTLNRLSLGGRNFFAENLRIAQTLDTMQRYLKDLLFDSTFLAPIRRTMQRIIYWRRKPLIDESAPATVRYMLQDMGPTFVKLGQIISSRRGQLPSEWQYELAQLQSEVEPFPKSEVDRIVKEELHGAPEELYDNFSATPLAAASTAQVHRANLRSGEEVVVKVQRPDIDVTVRADLNVIRDLARFAEQRFAFARDADLHAIISEYATNIISELDYTNEAFNGRLLAHNMRLFSTIQVPKVYAELSTERVMTQEFVRGVKITNIAAIAAAGLDRKLLAQTFVKAIVKQVIYDGFFHGDPHPGNILVDTVTGNIIFLDLGMMGTLTSDKRMALADLIWSLSERDGREVARTVLNLTVSSRKIDEEAFFQDTERLLKRFTAFPDVPLSVSGAMSSILDGLQRAGLRLDPDLTLALKAMIQAEESAHLLDPDLPLVQTCMDATRDLFVETFDPDKVLGALRTQSIRAAKQVVRSIPSLESAVGGWLQQFMKGKFTIYLDSSDLKNEIDQLDRTFSGNVRKMAYALLLAGLLIGSGVASTSTHPTAPLIGQLAYWIFVGAALCTSAVIVYAVWRWLSGKSI